MAVDRIELDELIGLRVQAGAIELGARLPVMSAHAGHRISGFRSRGMDFEEHRPYQPGDEARLIDPRVSARRGRLHVRVYREERERPVLLAVDLRPAMWFGTRGCFKAVQATRAAALCAWAAAGGGDRVGGLRFGHGTHEESRPRAGVAGPLRLFAALSRAPGAAEERDDEFRGALQRLVRLAGSGSFVVVLSDFRGLRAAEAGMLRRIGRHAAMAFVFIHDPLEAELPPPGLYPLALAAGAKPVLIDTADRTARARWREAFATRRDGARELARALGARWVELSTADAVVAGMARAFARRAA